MNTPTNAIVVAVSADGADAALTFAVNEARRSQRPLHLVHVLPIKAGEAYAGVYGGMLDTAKATLDEAQKRAEELAGDDVPVTAELIDNGWVVDDLVRHTERRLGPGAPAPGEEQGTTHLHRVDRPECRRSLPGAGCLRAGGLGAPHRR